VTVKFGISMRDEIHAAASTAAAAEGVPLSTFIDRVVGREIYRRQVAEHNAMLRDAHAADPGELHARVEARRARHRQWKAVARDDHGEGDPV
jgi:hypothetical protein